MKGKAFVVTNPQAGKGRGRRLRGSVHRLLKEKLKKFDGEESTAIGHARVLAADAAKAGYSPIVACGGDGTVHEVVNGIFDVALKEKPSLGILNLGTGGDFVKTLELPQNLEKQVKIIRGNRTRMVDLGRVTYTNVEGKKERCVFVNVADAGLGAEVVRKIHRSRRSYLTATLSSYFSWKSKNIILEVEPEQTQSHWPHQPLSVVVANGRYFGGGMPIAPEARLDDGFFDLVVIDELSAAKAFLAIPLLYVKKLTLLPGVHWARVRSVTLSSPEKVGLDIDGEPIGFLPVKFEVIPQAISVLVP